MSTNAATREQTLLRVKRRRNENPPSTIRLELLGGWNVRRQDENEDSNNIPNDGGQHAYPLRSSSTATLGGDSSAMSSSSAQTANATNVTSSRGRTTTAAAVWKRVEVLEGDHNALGDNKRCRVLDAILEGDGRCTKRRKLTVLGESTDVNKNAATKKKKNIYKVLDPTSRLVDDSLNMVHAGEKSVSDHYNLVTTDPRLAINSRTWLLYQNRGGNLLHACASWNDVELTHDLLRQGLSGLTDSTDEDGRTPYEVAQLAGNMPVIGVLEAFGADTSNYVYDMFVPEEIEVDMTQQQQPSASEEEKEEEWNPLEKTTIDMKTPSSGTASFPRDNSGSSNVQTSQEITPAATMMDATRLLELQGGVGYWTEEGELILEVEAHHMMGVTGEFGHESDDEYEDDIDSNCEDYGGNDYPDEDTWEEDFMNEEQLLDDEDDSLGVQGPTEDDYDGW